jgi:hypothetical protein
MTEAAKKLDPFDRLTPEQKARLQGLSSEISFDRLTVSFSLEGRDGNGFKRSSFFSLGCSRKTDESAKAEGFSQEEIRVVRCVVSKQVVSTVYDDAVKRGLMSRSQAGEELRPILESYDNHIVRLLSGEG